MTVPPQPFILFTDLVGSTVDANQDPAGAANRRRQMIAATLQAVKAAEGFVGQYTGDGFLCLAPSLKAAVLAGERIIRKISATGQAVRVAVHYTDQLSEDIKFWHHDALEADADGILRASTAAFMYFESTYGAIAFAARLLGCANPNQILVSYRAHQVEGAKAADAPKWLTHPAQRFKDGQPPQVVIEYLWDGASKGVPHSVYVPSFYHRRLGLYIDRPALEDKVIRAIEQGRDPMHPKPIVAIYGDGGMGKTRLAEAVTLRIAYQYRHIASISIVEDGVVDLNTAHRLCDPAPEIGQSMRAEQMPAIAQELRRIIAQRFKLTLDDEAIKRDYARAFLDAWEIFAKANQPGLLVLDNWEPLNFRDEDPVAARSCVWLLNDLVRVAPQWSILLTTRDKPKTDGLADVSIDDGMTETEAAQLIRKRWEEAGGPEPTETDVAALVAACGGYPLAIELAVSARGDNLQLTLGQIAAAVQEDIASLKTDTVRSESETARSRHASLQACLNFSYNLLTAEEQRVFRAAGALVAQWTWDTGNEVLQTNGKTQTSLVRASRFRTAQVTTGSASAEVLSMHRHVWEFARALLDAANERSAVEARLVAWTRAFLSDPEDPTRFDSLEIEEGNWSRGLRLIARRDATAGIFFAYILQYYAYHAQRFSDLGRWSSDPELAPSARAAALDLTGDSLFREGRNQEALQAWEQADQYYQQSGNPQGRGNVAFSRGNLHFQEGRSQEALQAWEQADQYYQQSGNPQGRGNVAKSQGEPPLPRRKKPGSPTGMGTSRSILSTIRHSPGTRQRRLQPGEPPLPRRKKPGSPTGMGTSRSILSTIRQSPETRECRQKPGGPPLPRRKKPGSPRGMGTSR